MYAPHQKIS